MRDVTKNVMGPEDISILISGIKEKDGKFILEVRDRELHGFLWLANSSIYLKSFCQHTLKHSCSILL